MLSDRDLAYKIVGAAMNVYNELHGGLLEGVYQEALCLELTDLGVNVEMEKEVEIYYKHHKMKKKYRLDLIVANIICELKSVSEILPAHRSQLCNYLRLTRKPLGILINFGLDGLEGERWAYDIDSNECYLVDVDLNPIPYKVI